MNKVFFQLFNRLLRCVKKVSKILQLVWNYKFKGILQLVWTAQSLIPGGPLLGGQLVTLTTTMDFTNRTLVCRWFCTLTRTLTSQVMAKMWGSFLCLCSPTITVSTFPSVQCSHNQEFVRALTNISQQKETLQCQFGTCVAAKSSSWKQFSHHTHFCWAEESQGRCYRWSHIHCLDERSRVKWILPDLLWRQRHVDCFLQQWWAVVSHRSLQMSHLRCIVTIHMSLNFYANIFPFLVSFTTVICLPRQIPKASSLTCQVEYPQNGFTWLLLCLVCMRGRECRASSMVCGISRTQIMVWQDLKEGWEPPLKLARI